MKKLRILLALIAISSAITLCIRPKSAEAQYMGGKCCTSMGWCFIVNPSPIGDACFCDGWAGRRFGNVCN